MAGRERGKSERCSGQCHPLLPAGGGNLGQPTCPEHASGAACSWRAGQLCWVNIHLCPSSCWSAVPQSRAQRPVEATGILKQKLMSQGKCFPCKERSHLSVLACTVWLWAGWVCTIACSITRHRLLWVLTVLGRRRKEIQPNRLLQGPCTLAAKRGSIRRASAATQTHP